MTTKELEQRVGATIWSFESNVYLRVNPREQPPKYRRYKRVADHEWVCVLPRYA
jgi:hypothetical protein